MARIVSGGLYGAQVNVWGLEGLMNRLEQIDPTLRRQLDREIKDVASGIAASAAGRLHPGPNNSAGSYVVSRRRNKVSVVNRSRGAMISEFAGRVNPEGLTPQGRTLIQTLNAAYGRPGRLVWQAWDEQADAVMAQVTALVHKVEGMVGEKAYGSRP